MLGIIPAAGVGSRIQPLAFSKELLPVGSRFENGAERPRAVSDYLIERLLRAGVDRICFVISRRKRDILEYYGGSVRGVDICYAVQERPAGLCDAVFRALPLARPDEDVLLGLPDTIWFPEDGLAGTPAGSFCLLLFPTDDPASFDAVRTDPNGNVREVRVKQPDVGCRDIWGAMRIPGAVLHELHALWLRREPRDEYLGTLINAYLAEGGSVRALRAGQAYFDVGTVGGYRRAVGMLPASEEGSDSPELTAS